MLGMLLFGTAGTINGKYLDEATSPKIPKEEGCYNFSHPYFQTTLMFTGEFLCFLLLGIKKLIDYRARQQPDYVQPIEKKRKNNINPLLLAIPASCDVCGSTLTFLGLLMCPPSVYQMMRGSIVVITALFTIVFLKRKLYRHHLAGVLCIVFGEIAVGLASINSPSETSQEDAAEELFGIILLILAQFFLATMFIVEEYLLDGYELEPFFIVGSEGMWGLSYYIVFLPMM
jgi:drug/metabolite transporter (DMT)-like permease